MSHETLLNRGLDYYKPTMSQHHFEHNPDTEVTFTFKNRGEQRLADYLTVEDLQARFDAIQERGFTDDELDYYAELKHPDGTAAFSTNYLNYLRGNELPRVNVAFNEDQDDIAMTATGDAPLVTFWETVIMSEVNEMYFENYLVKHNVDPAALYAEGDRRLTQKIEQLRERPDIKFSEFGTRRHFSYKWQRYVTNRLRRECPDNFVGTSNVALSEEIGYQPIGTFAHEMPMIYAGIADAKSEDIRQSHNQFLQDWRNQYGDNLNVALTDTFGTDFFFEDFTPEQAREWNALRHDSGDPIEFGEKTIAFYKANGIDPATKTIVFSDGLNLDKIIELQDHFGGRINTTYGWGTTLTNDLGIKPLNIVMKATHVTLPNGAEADLVKLSDNKGKHTGPEAQIKRYQTIFAATGKLAAKDVVVC